MRAARHSKPCLLIFWVSIPPPPPPPPTPVEEEEEEDAGDDVDQAPPYNKLLMPGKDMLAVSHITGE